MAFDILVRKIRVRRANPCLMHSSTIDHKGDVLRIQRQSYLERFLRGGKVGPLFLQGETQAVVRRDQFGDILQVQRASHSLFRDAELDVDARLEMPCGFLSS